MANDREYTQAFGSRRSKHGALNAQSGEKAITQQQNQELVSLHKSPRRGPLIAHFGHGKRKRI